MCEGDCTWWLTDGHLCTNYFFVSLNRFCSFLHWFGTFVLPIAVKNMLICHTLMDVNMVTCCIWVHTFKYTCVHGTYSLLPHVMSCCRHIIWRLWPVFLWAGRGALRRLPQLVGGCDGLLKRLIVFVQLRRTTVEGRGERTQCTSSLDAQVEERERNLTLGLVAKTTASVSGPQPVSAGQSRAKTRSSAWDERRDRSPVMLTRRALRVRNALVRECMAEFLGTFVLLVSSRLLFDTSEIFAKC